VSTTFEPESGTGGPLCHGSVAGKLLAVLLWILAAIVILFAVAAITLLLVATSVPTPISLTLAVAEILLVVALFSFRHSALRTAGVLIAIALIPVLAVWLSQVFATTPPILDDTGEPMPGSIASLEKVQLGDSEQWVSIRGRDTRLPVLLFLAGGPGGSQLATARRNLGKLEDHFVVVNWEQPGSGKSFNAVDRSALTPDDYVEYGHELALYLRERFGQDKIYIVGESWGSALGIMLVQRYPDLFHAFAGTGQMVDFLETDLRAYDFALSWAEERGDAKKVDRLREQGPPPYYGRGLAWKQATYLLDTFAFMNENPAIADNGMNTFGDLASPEYGLIDKVNWVRGPLDTLGHVYPHLWDIDLREQASELEVPVYFLIGRHDVNASPELAEDYFNLLQAPHKELVWFEHSGHTPWTSEADRFVDVVVNTVLANTQGN